MMAGFYVTKMVRKKKSAELPYVEPCAANETVIMKNIIPQEYKGMTLTFLSADKELRVRLDGKIIYEFGKHDKRLFGHTPGSVTNFVKIPEHFGRGEIQIEMVSPYNDYATNIRTISVATEKYGRFDAVKGKSCKLCFYCNNYFFRCCAYIT